MVTAAQANALVAEDKVIEGTLAWRDDPRGFRLRADAAAPRSGRTLALHGYVGRKNRSIALVFEDAPIRRFTVHRSHTNPDTGQTLLGPHLHTWDDQWGGELAQPPRNITVGDPNDELFDFLREFNTLLRGAYEPLRAERASARGISW